MMVKPVGASCNLSCSYCYYLHNEVSMRKRMSFDNLEKIISSYLTSYKGRVFSFVWHGGEPCLAGLDFYKKAVELQKKYLPEGAECWNNLQTNGLLLDEEWCAFLKKEHFDIGLSIDGIRLVHDTYRKDASGKGTFDAVKEKIALLKEYGIRPDLLCTVSFETAKYAYEVYHSLKSFQTGWIQFIPIVNKNEDGTLKSESVSAEAYGNFLVCVFHQWLYNDLGSCNVQLFMELLNVCLGGGQSLCWLREECGDVLAIECDGEVYSCDHFVNRDNDLGNIGKEDLRLLAGGEKQAAFSRRKSELSGKCRNCAYLNFCHGGCPKDREEDGNNVLCEGLLRLFEEAAEPLEKTAALLKEGKKAKQIMEILRKERKERWKDVSGNAPCPCGSGRKYKHCCR